MMYDSLIVISSHFQQPSGQPGHKGTHRELIPVEDVDEVIPLYPQIGEKCQKKQQKTNVVKEPLRWQVTELPPLEPTVVEYQCFTTKCPCGHINKASLPDEVGRSNFGSRLVAIISYLVAVSHLSRRNTAVFCQSILGVNLCLGSLQNMSGAREPVDKELQDALPSEAVINLDETG